MAEIIITGMDRLSPVHNTKKSGYTSDVYRVTDTDEKYEVTGAFQGHQTVVAFYRLPPGQSGYPFHYHTTNEEVFYIISGEGVLETCAGETRVRAGDVMVFPAGE